MADLIPPAARSEHAVGETKRDRALKRLERQSKLRADMVAYVVINAFLVGV